MHFTIIKNKIREELYSMDPEIHNLLEYDNLQTTHG